MVLQHVYKVTFVKSTLGNDFNGIERMTCKMLPLQKITMNDPEKKIIELMVVTAKIILHSLHFCAESVNFVVIYW
jgi:hypothetical protein